MTPFEELCKRLDELGIKYETPAKGCVDVYTNDFKYMFYAYIGRVPDERFDDKVFVETDWLTPEQAIAATVGAEKLDTSELWPEWEQVLFANVTDEVAQDNLNECVHELLEKAATVGGTCHFSVQDNLAETDGMGDVWLECDECHWQMPLEPSTPRFKFCPNCRRRIEEDE